MIRCAECEREAPEWAVQHFTGSCPWCLASTRPLKNYRKIMVEPAIVPPSVKARGVPAELDSIILKCLSHNPADRYASAAELSRDLRNWRKGEAVEAHSKGVIYRGWKFAIRKKVAVAAVVAVAVVGLWIADYGARRAVDVEVAGLISRGSELIESDDDAEAVEALSAALAIRPNVKAYLLRGFAYWRLMDFEAAEADAELALAIAPDPEIRKFRDDARRENPARR